MKKKILSLSLIAAVLLSCFTGCAAQSEKTPVATEPPAAAEAPAEQQAAAETAVTKPDGYPAGPVSWIVPAAAGAANDLATRALNDCMDLGGNVVIENIVGASQTIGTAEAALRNADGQTLLTCANVGMLLMPMTTELNYDMADFRHIAMMAEPITMVVCVKNGSEIKTSEDWVNLVTSGESFTYSHPAGVGGLGYLASADFLGQMKSAGGQFVAYDGSAAVLTAVLNGEIDWAIMDEGDVSNRVKSGELTALYLIDDEASPHTAEILPEIPCLAELGVTGMSLYKGYKWVAVRSDTPEDVVAWIKLQLNQAIQSEKYQEWLVTSGFGNVREYTEEEMTEIFTSFCERCKEVLGK